MYAGRSPFGGVSWFEAFPCLPEFILSALPAALHNSAQDSLATEPCTGTLVK